MQHEMILDGTKIEWYLDRVRAWERGERIAPITIDMALTTCCNMKCIFCYSQLQRDEKKTIKREHITRFLEDCSTIGVKGVSLVSDGESSISPDFAYTIKHGASKGLAMATGTNAYLLKGKMLEEVFPHLSYLRVNISAGEETRYNKIMGAHGDMFYQVCKNIETMVRLKEAGFSKCTVGMQMVLMPEFIDQVLPLSKLALNLGVDYLIIKHCSDDEFGHLGVNYGKYKDTFETLKRAESWSTSRTLIKAKWSKLNECGEEGAVRSYQRCYGPPFVLQISGTGLVAPCGFLFNERYKRFHMGDITKQGFREIWESKAYWDIISELASEKFDARTMCGSLCLQHSLYKYLDEYKKGERGLVEPTGKPPIHKEFI